MPKRISTLFALTAPVFIESLSIVTVSRLLLFK